MSKVRVQGFTGPQREGDVRYEFYCKPILKALQCK